MLPFYVTPVNKSLIQATGWVIPMDSEKQRLFTFCTYCCIFTAGPSTHQSF